MKRIVLLIISMLFVCLPSFAEESDFDGTIDLEKIINSKETERQMLQNINSVLNQVNNKIKDTAGNVEAVKGLLYPEPEYARDTDTSDEFNLEYYLNILKDGSWKEKVYAYIEELGENINNTNNQIQGIGGNTLVSPILCFLLIGMSFVVSLIICSISVVTAMETSKFIVVNVTQVAERALEDKVRFAEVSAPKIVPLRVDIKEKPVKKIVKPQESPFVIACNKQEWIELGKGAILNLSQYTSNDEFKKVYGYSQKKSMSLSTRALEVAIAEADKAMGHMVISDQTGESLLSALIKGKSAEKYNGNKMNGTKSVLLSTDFAYLIALSSSDSEQEKQELWSHNSWN